MEGNRFAFALEKSLKSKVGKNLFCFENQKIFEINS